MDFTRFFSLLKIQPSGNGLYPFFSLLKIQPSGTAFAPAKSYTFKR